jgi:hypothetical protein
MNRQEAIAFARSSAVMAVDQARDFGGLESAINSYRENVRDTLNDEDSAQHESAAFAAYDDEVARVRP